MNNRKFINREIEKQAKFMSDQLEIEINRDREKHAKAARARKRGGTHR